MVNVGWVIAVASALYAGIIMLVEYKNKLSKNRNNSSNSGFAYVFSLTGLYLGFIFSFTAFSIDNYNILFIEQYKKQNDFEINKMIDKEIQNEEVYRIMIEKIVGKIEEINNQNIELSSPELEAFVQMRMKSLLVSGLEYKSTHIISDPDDIKPFSDFYLNNFQSVPKFMQIQKEIVDMGGSILRIFIVTEQFITNDTNQNKFNKMLGAYNEFFNNSNSQYRLILYNDAYDKLTTPSSPEVPELSILNKSEVFKWIENEKSECERYSGGFYITNKQKVKKINEYFKTIETISLDDIDVLVDRLK